jgi:hypothetical protein
MPPASQTAVTISEKTTSAIQIADALADKDLLIVLNV